MLYKETPRNSKKVCKQNVKMEWLTKWNWKRWTEYDTDDYKYLSGAWNQVPL